MPDLELARRRFHAASQWLARLAYAYATPLPDDAHSSLIWRGDLITTVPLGADAVVASLNGITLELRLGDVAVSLDGLDEGERESRIRATLSKTGFAPEKLELDLPWGTEAPSASHKDEESDVNADSAKLLVDLYRTAADRLGEVVESDAGASPVRLWPHHFDIATLLKGAPEAGENATVGVGLAPDDASSDTPYLYVSPWPYLEGNLPKTPSGWTWHTEGFTALIAPVTDVLQIEALDLDAAVACARSGSS